MSRPTPRVADEIAARNRLTVIGEYTGAARGLDALVGGRPGEALSLLADVDARVERTGRRLPGVLQWEADLLEAMVRAEQHEAARGRLAELERRAAETSHAWGGAVAARIAGLLADDHRAALRGGAAPPRDGDGALRGRPYAALLRPAAAPRRRPHRGARAAARRRRRLPRDRRGTLGRGRRARARRDRRAPAPPGPRHARGADDPGARDRRPRRRRRLQQGRRGRAVPQPQDRRGPPDPRLPQARRELPEPARAPARGGALGHGELGCGGCRPSPSSSTRSGTRSPPTCQARWRAWPRSASRGSSRSISPTRSACATPSPARG